MYLDTLGIQWSNFHSHILENLSNPENWCLKIAEKPQEMAADMGRKIGQALYRCDYMDVERT
jgi:hypothetical protein